MIRIREARENELHVVLALMRTAFAESAREEHPSSALRETLDDVRDVARRGGAILALEPGGSSPALGDARPLGSARFVVDAVHRFLAYERLAVHPAARGRGIGTAMIDWLEAHARTLGLAEVRADARSQMPDNRPFYLARGYEITGYADRYGIAGLRTHLSKKT